MIFTEFLTKHYAKHQISSTSNSTNLCIAYDLILISGTSSGLQNCLNRLQCSYQKCKLNVKIKKTRTVIVSERQPSVQNQFTFETKPLDICKSYTYLVSIISNNGSFKLNINALCKSASRAMYNLLSNVNKHASGNVY